MTQNPIAKAVRRIRPKVKPDERRKLSRKADNNDGLTDYQREAVDRLLKKPGKHILRGQP
jgi:hypothetical protein